MSNFIFKYKFGNNIFFINIDYRCDVLDIVVVVV